jgi:hypothetical protein
MPQIVKPNSRDASLFDERVIDTANEIGLSDRLPVDREKHETSRSRRKVSQSVNSYVRQIDAPSAR